MGTSRNRRITEAIDVKRRAKAPAPYGPQPCAIPGCKRLTQRSSRKGLSETYCHRHVEHLRSHGHITRKSYSKAELEPFRQPVARWLREHREDPNVQAAIARLGTLMATQGRPKDAYEQRGMVPKAKARNELARLYAAGKSGEQLLGIVLTIRAAHAELGPWDSPDWYHVQIAKQAKRLRGARSTPYRDKRFPPRYPRGEGIFMRILGKSIDAKAACAIDGETIEYIRRQARPHISRPASPPPSQSQARRDDLREERRRMEELRSLLGGGGISIETL